MSTLKIEETFSVAAPLAAVWRFVSDPNRVAACLPGAQLTGQDGANTFLGTMKVKVGPVMTDFKGRATLSEVDEQAHSLRLTGSGDDKSGGGSAKLAMKLSVSALAADSSQVSVQADVELAGKLVRFGRGMFEAVAKQLFKQFVERARTAIAAQPAPDPSASAPVPAAEPAAPVPPPAQVTEPAQVAVEPAAPVEPPATAEPAVVAEPVAPSPAGSAPAIIPAPAAVAVKPAQKEEALDAGSLIFAVIWAWLKGLWRRIF